LALAAAPPFAGYYSKDAIIEAVHLSQIPGATYAYWCLLIGSFVTGFYIFRAFFMAFHTKERMDEKLRSHLKETHWTMLTGMITLAVPSVLLGMFLIRWILYKSPALLGKSIYILPQYDVLSGMATHFQGALDQTLHSVFTRPFWFAISGIFMAWLLVVMMPQLAGFFSRRFSLIQKIFIGQYGFDWFNERVITRSTRWLATFFFHTGDLKLLDYFFVDGAGRGVIRVSRMIRRLQSGYVYHYAFVMILGLLGFLIWLVW